MSYASTKKIKSLVTQLKSYTPQLNKIERAPRMIKISEATKQAVVNMSFLGQLANKISALSQPIASSIYPVPVKVEKAVSDLENAFNNWFQEWKKVATETPYESFSRPPDLFFLTSSSVPFGQEKLSPMDSLVIVYQQIIDLLYAYQFYLKYVDLVILKILPLISELFQTYTLQATSPHWFYLPTVRIRDAKLPAGSSQEEILKQLKISRHPIDPRFDFRDLHNRTVNNGTVETLMKRFCDLLPNASSLSATSPHSATSASPPLSTGSNRHLTERMNKDHLIVDGARVIASEHFYALLTATYPMVPASRAISPTKSSPMSSAPLGLPPPTISSQAFTSPPPTAAATGPDELILLNDPNNDGFLCIVGDGWAVGATTDGSGAGPHARHASNIFLATFLDMVVGDVSTSAGEGGAKDETLQAHQQVDFTKFCFSQVPWKTSHDCLNFLEKVCRQAQANICETDEAGATTVILYTLTRMADEEVRGYRDNSPRFSEKFKSGDEVFCLNYCIAGDSEGLYFDDVAQEWRSLVQPPHVHDGVRLQTSFTPGGIGRHHGERNIIYGAYLWPDYIRKDGENYDPARWVSFYAHPSNIHFGQCFLGGNDFFVMTSDGFGDTVDPIQLFPKPNLVIGLDKYDSWHQFSKEYPKDPKMVLRKLREMVYKAILDPVMNPYVEEESTSAGKDAEIETPSPTAKQILNTLIKHSMTVTREERKLYSDPEFLSANKWGKQSYMEKKVGEWIERNWPKTVTLGSPTSTVPYAPPAVYVPFAKIDHLGMQVVRPKIVSNVSSVRMLSSKALPVKGSSQSKSGSRHGSQNQLNKDSTHGSQNQLGKGSKHGSQRQLNKDSKQKSSSTKSLNSRK